MPIKIPTQFFTDLKRTIWKKKPRIAKIILYNNKGTSRNVTTPDIKLYYRVTLMKTSWLWHKIETV